MVVGAEHAEIRAGELLSAVQAFEGGVGRSQDVATAFTAKAGEAPAAAHLERPVPGLVVAVVRLQLHGGFTGPAPLLPLAEKTAERPRPHGVASHAPLTPPRPSSCVQ
jgi:hypothetical protein